MIPKPKPTTSYSKDTQAMLDKMMSASGLPKTEQRRLRAACAAGPSAPLPAARRRPAGAGARPHQYEDLLKGVPINPRMNLPGAHRRTQAMILAEHGGSLERDQYGGGPPPADRAAQVLQLQQQMEFGRVLPEGPSAAGPSRGAPKPKPRAERPEDALRSSIIAEIDERRQFIETMRAAGKTEHEEAIQGQIAERLNDLKRLEALESND